MRSLLGFFFATLLDHFIESLLGWFAVPLLFLIVPLVQLPLWLGLRIVTRRAKEISVADLRTPVLFLRSFRDDRLQVPTMSLLQRMFLV